MPINDYSEKDIRNKIISKLNPEIKKRKSSHDKGYIRSGGKVVTKVKIPNSHTRLMRKSKSQFIATALRLNDDQFNDLIDCPLKGPEYYEILKEVFLEK
jgi:hypothetical protein